jgi:hypothetical protein
VVSIHSPRPSPSKTHRLSAKNGSNPDPKTSEAQSRHAGLVQAIPASFLVYIRATCSSVGSAQQYQGSVR